MGFSLSLPLPPLPGISFSSGEKKQVNQTNITNNFYNNTGGNTMGGGNGGFMDAFNSLDQAASGGNFAFASAGPNGAMAMAGNLGQGQQANGQMDPKQFGAFLEKVGGDLKDDGMLNKSNQQQQQNPMQKIMQMMMGMMQMIMGMMGGQGQGQDQNNPLQMLGLS